MGEGGDKGKIDRRGQGGIRITLMLGGHDDDETYIHTRPCTEEKEIGRQIQYSLPINCFII